MNTQTTTERETTLRFAARPDREAAAHALYMRVLEGPDAGLEASAADGAAVIGRAPGCTLRLTDPTVSQYHVELAGLDGLIGARDLGSQNGTFVGAVALDRGFVPAPCAFVLGASTILVASGAPAPRHCSRATGFGALVGTSQAMREVYALLEKLAPASLSVVIEGATGTGKELAARALHDRSPRAGAPFVALACTALRASSADIVLFGDEQRPGVFEAAGAGTLLLDHVGELPPLLQTKLLRALDEREVMPVGAIKPVRVEARIVSTTQHSLRELVNRGAFRDDLYFRLAGARVAMPSLAERPEDKKPLATHFLAELGPHERGARSFSSEALAALASRAFPGNVRELKSAVERAAVLAEGQVIEVDDLAFERILAEHPPDDAHIEPFKEAKRTVIDDFEKAYLARVLARAGRNVSRAAAIAGIERHSLRNLLRRHDLREVDEDA